MTRKTGAQHTIYRTTAIAALDLLAARLAQGRDIGGAPCAGANENEPVQVQAGRR